METDLGRHLRQRFPSVEMKEDVFTDSHYWLNIRLGHNQWIVIEAFTEGGFGVSTACDGEPDFGGHDEQLEDADAVLRCVEARLVAAGHA